MIESSIKDFLKKYKDGKSFAQELKNIYPDAGKSQIRAWEDSYEHIRELFEELKKAHCEKLHSIFEYRLPLSSERTDLILIGRKTDKHKLLVVELKGWSGYNKNSLFSPLRQLIGYIEKIKCFHSMGDEFEISGILWFYNLKGKPSVRKTCNGKILVFRGDDYKEFARYIQNIMNGAPEEQKVREFLNSKYRQCQKLLEFIRERGDAIRNLGIRAIFSSGFYPSEEQKIIIEKVIDALQRGEKRVFFISGGPGSGKTYIALSLLIEAFRRVKGEGKMDKNIAALAYVNNRFLNALRSIFKNSSNKTYNKVINDGAIKYIATGKGEGLAERVQRDTYRLVIYDEAQRMEEQNIYNALRIEDDIKVFLFDENQILLPQECGTKDNFLRIARELNVNYTFYELKNYYRVEGGEDYHRFVEELLSGRSPSYTVKNYELKVFQDIEKMLETLRSKKKEGFKVALIASFTESKGNKKNLYSIYNRRVGYPLPSGFDLYKDKKLSIYWAMLEKENSKGNTEPEFIYTKFWLEGACNNLKTCASVYGCQGFEADYVGVIWGRDMVWREKGWALGDNCEDNRGGKSALKKLFYKAKKNGDYEVFSTVLRLLKNRYRIFLTRGIKGTYIFCEDRETASYLQNLIRKSCLTSLHTPHKSSLQSPFHLLSNIQTLP